MNKMIIGSIVVALFAIGGIFVLLRERTPNNPGGSGAQTNVRVVDGTQIIEITAKGGYAPRVTLAKAQMPTVLQVKTNGTFDCSSALTVPSVGFRTMLPATGVTPVEIPPQPPGARLKGVCSMGMYSFTVNFE